MPFTFAHPLYIAPLKAVKPAYFSLTGLLLGSMSPDFEYFIALEPYRTIGHSLSGLLLQAIPLSIVLAYLFHYIVKIPLAENLPALGNLDLDRRARSLTGDWKLNHLKSWLVFLVSIIIGFYSHVLIDACTHYSGMFVTKYSFFRDTLTGIPLYKWFQRSLSLFGLFVEAIFIMLLLSRVKMTARYSRVTVQMKQLYWAIVLLFTVITVALKLLITSSTNYIGMFIVSSISGFIIGVVAASIVYRVLARKKKL